MEVRPAEAESTKLAPGIEPGSTFSTPFLVERYVLTSSVPDYTSDGQFGYVSYTQTAWSTCLLDLPLHRSDICLSLLSYTNTPPPGAACEYIGKFRKFPSLEFKRTGTRGWCCGTGVGSCVSNEPRCDTNRESGYWGVACCDSQYVKLLAAKRGSAARNGASWVMGFAATFAVFLL
jgi:hypothetical protein